MEGTTMNARTTWVLGLLLTALLLAAACSADDLATVERSTGDSPVVGEEMAAPDPAAAPGGADGDEAAADPGTTDSAGADLAFERESTRASDVQVDDLPVTTPPLGDRIIKEGTITVEVPPGEFDTAFAAVVRRAQALGGDVVASSSRTDDEERVRGSITVRVPVRSYEDLLTGIGDIGTITDRSISSQDVTAEFTDLESRRRHLQAQERFYLGLLDEAASVQDAIAVQQQLQQIQAQIEQITGRLNVLDDRTSFSTLTVDLREEGAEAGPDPEGLTGPSRLAEYWQTAQEAFFNVIGVMLVALLFAAPVAAIGLIVWLVARPALRRRHDGHRTTHPTAGAGPGSDREAQDVVGVD